MREALNEVEYEFERWWREIEVKLRLLALGVDLVRYETFDHVAPDTNIAVDGVRRIVRNPDDSIVHTSESADFALTFLLDTIVRLQDIERLPPRGSYHTIQIDTDTPFFDVDSEGGAPAGTLKAGSTIEGAHIGLSRQDASEPTAWFWRDEKAQTTYLIPRTKARSISHMSRKDFQEKVWNQQHRAAQKRENKGPTE